MNKAPKPKAQRLDDSLVSRGLAEDLREARALILSGRVVLPGGLGRFAGELVPAQTELRVKGSRFVSRGGDKLWGAIESLGLSREIQGLRVLDIGASTGGFTDCSLKLGAAEVVAVDIGSAQLAPKLVADPRVRVFEQRDFRELAKVEIGRVDFCVADLSFMPLAPALPALRNLLEPGVRALLLIKPQFELGYGEVPKGGVVRSPELQAKAVSLVENALEFSGFQSMALIESSLKGRRGNREYFSLVRAL